MMYKFKYLGKLSVGNAYQLKQYRGIQILLNATIANK